MNIMISNKNANISFSQVRYNLCISSTAIGSTPANGSSNNIKEEPVARHLAISVLLLSPPDNKLYFF